MKDFDVTQVIKPRKQEWDTQAMWAAVNGELGTDSSRGVGGSRLAVQKGPGKKVAVAYSSYSLRRWVSFGVLAASCVGVIYLWNHLSVVPSSAAPVTKNYVTSPGQRAKITLASGTQVTLAPSTKLSVSNNEIFLDGQAVFTILHKDGSPFKIRTREALVKVLGTTFSVRAYKTDRLTRVAVAEGKVSVNDAVLSVSDAVDISQSGTFARHGIDIIPEFSWTEGKLVFNNAPLSEVVAQLERWYNVKIHIQDPELRSRPVTNTFFEGTLTTNELDLFVRSLDIQYKRSGGSITFFRRYPK